MDPDSIDFLQQLSRVVHISTTGITIFFLLYIWYKYHTYYQHLFSGSHSGDYGLLILSLALLTWASIFLSQLFDKELNHSAIKHILSVLNNGLFLCSFPFFSHGFEKLKENKYRVRWFLTITSISVLAIILIVLATTNEGESEWIKTGSFALSLLTIVGMAVLLFNTFMKRKLLGIAILTALIMSFLIAGQYMKAFHSDDIYIITREAINITSFMGMCALFISLALTWIFELSNNLNDIHFSKDPEIQKSYSAFQNPASTLEIHQKIDGFVERDLLEELLPMLISYSRNYGGTGMLHNLINISAQLSRINTDRIRNTISDQDYLTARSRIRNSIQEIKHNIQ